MLGRLVGRRVGARRTAASAATSWPEHSLEQTAHGSSATDRARQQVAEVLLGRSLVLVEFGEIGVGRPAPDRGEAIEWGLGRPPKRCEALSGMDLPEDARWLIDGPPAAGQIE